MCSCKLYYVSLFSSVETLDMCPEANVLSANIRDALVKVLTMPLYPESDRTTECSRYNNLLT